MKGHPSEEKIMNTKDKYQNIVLEEGDWGYGQINKSEKMEFEGKLLWQYIEKPFEYPREGQVSEVYETSDKKFVVWKWYWSHFKYFKSFMTIEITESLEDLEGVIPGKLFREFKKEFDIL